MNHPETDVHRICETIRAHVKETGNNEVDLLEVGSGNGGKIFQVKTALGKEGINIHVTAVDHELNLSEEVREEMESSGDKFFKCLGMEFFKEHDGREFDLILMINTFHCMGPNKGEVIPEIMRTLRPEGKFMCLEPHFKPCGWMDPTLNKFILKEGKWVETDDTKRDFSPDAWGRKFRIMERSEQLLDENLPDLEKVVYPNGKRGFIWTKP